MEENTKIDQPEEKKDESQVPPPLTPEQIAEYLKFVGLTTCSTTTTFLNIPYDYGKGGRVLIVLGQLGLHARAKFKHNYVKEDEQLAMKKIVEERPDTIITSRKEDVRTIVMEASYPEYSNNHNLTEEERNKLPAKAWTMVVVCKGASFRVPGLDTKTAFFYRAVIWNWMLGLNN